MFFPGFILLATVASGWCQPGKDRDEFTGFRCHGRYRGRPFTRSSADSRLCPESCRHIAWPGIEASWWRWLALADPAPGLVASTPIRPARGGRHRAGAAPVGV